MSFPVVALTLHAIAEPEPGDAEAFYRISPAEFESLLRRLRERGTRSWTSAQVLRYLRGELQPDAPVAVLTFDDGHRSHAEHALPLLQRYGFTGCFFITTGFVGTEGYMDWTGVRRLAEAGMEIGAHGHEHVPLTGLRDGALEGELERPRRLLGEALGREALSMAAPGGFWNHEVVEAAARAGYEALWLSEIGQVRAGCPVLKLPRVVVRRPFNLAALEPFLDGEERAFRRARLNQRALKTVRGVLGLRRYEALKRALFGHRPPAA